MQAQVIPKLPMEQYLAMPAVSASILKAMIDQCPKAAWHESWLNSEREREDSAEMDAGTIIHAILLEGNESGIEVIDPEHYPAEKTGAIPDGWTNKAIRQARDNARAAGKIQVLLDKYLTIKDAVSSARTFIESLKETEPAVWAAFQPGGGDSEATITWTDGKTPCRIRPDRLSKDRKLIVDLKTTTTSANPAQWARTQMIAQSGYMSAAFYRRGCKAAFGTEPEYLFLVVEQDAPHLCSLVGWDPHSFELGREKITTALDMWSRCVTLDQWPAYPNRAVYPEIPVWVDSQWQEQQQGSMDLYDKLFGRSDK